MIEDPELRQLFKAESAEHLARLDDGLLRLEKNCSDHALLEEVFREAHSMKGAARMLGLSKIETTSHGLESMLNSAYKGESALTPAVIERMTVTLGELRNMVREALTGTSAEPHVAEQASQVQLAVKPSPSADHKPVPPPFQGDDRNTGKPPEDSPKAPPPPPERLDKGAACEPFRIETVRVNTRQLDDLLILAGELSVIQGRWQHRLSLIDEMVEHWTNLERSRKKLHFLLRKSDLMDKSGEALRQMLHSDNETLAQLGNRIKQTRDAFYEDGARLDTTSNALEERVHAARLLPLSSVFSLFPRMVRDLAREQEKEVELIIEGGELDVDKHVLEEMKDPLMHLLRNAIDHGIEPPMERERLGKPRNGALKLRATRENNNIFMEVSDDGRGLDVTAIRHVALQRGLLDEDALAAMTTAQLQQLIFSPGFSTSDFVTELSGRGVGLDVVRANVERLKGDIRMESAPHRGTVVQLRLPLSLSTTRLLLVRVGGRRYGLPIEFVNTSRQVSEEDIFTLEGHPAFEFDGQAVIAPRLADLLNLPSENQDNETVCIVIQVGDEHLGLRVDELLDEEEVLTKPLGTPLRRVRNVSGLTILSNGEICVVLNPADLLRSTHKLSTAPAKRQPARTAQSVKTSILLVEDSVLVRVMEKRILEDAGYEVLAAVDGVDALNALSSHTFAAVVSDIMMPNMDGLTLTGRIRQDPRYHDLPVILVTSLASSEDKRRGLEVGANAYIPKPSFDQNILLDTLQRLIVP
ncbi:MAG: hybrid sensor histidine kinase/response regulator [Methylococcaceae bacterium]|nr:hybrid sensor histidine kinase/response regulator [Methylococcaceae bacterium]